MRTRKVKPKLFMMLLGCKPNGRHTEQHDIYFGIGNKMSDLIPQIVRFWPEANEKIHIDVWREVQYVGNFQIEVMAKINDSENMPDDDLKLFFLNLGGYKPNEFEEYHHKILLVAKSQHEAILLAKKVGFWTNFNFDKANSHIDDKYGLDIDDCWNVQDILPPELKNEFRISIKKSMGTKEDKIHIGYLKLHKL